MDAMVDAVLALFPEPARKQRRVREIAGVVTGLASAADLHRRVDALERLGHWVMKADTALPAPVHWVESLAPELRRLGVLLAVLEGAPQVGQAVRQAFAALVAETSGLGLLADTGLPNDRGFVNETANRLFRRVLPVPRDDHQLSRLLLRLFPSQAELDWIEGVPPDLFTAWDSCSAPMRTTPATTAPQARRFRR